MVLEIKYKEQQFQYLITLLKDLTEGVRKSSLDFYTYPFRHAVK